MSGKMHVFGVALSLAAVVAGMRLGRAPVISQARPGGRLVLPYPQRLSPESLAHLGEVAEQGNPFRSTRRPAPPVPAVEPSVEPARGLPSLRLQGIVGGPPWSALVEGVPAHEGSLLLQPGDTVGGIRVVSVRSNAVEVSMGESKWTLILREAIP